MKATEIAARAAELVGGDREKTHGNKLKNHANIAAVWTGILKAAGKLPANELTPLDVANMMEGLKIARRYLGAHNIDDYLDACGYSAVAGEIAEEMERINASLVDAASENTSELPPGGSLPGS